VTSTRAPSQSRQGVGPRMQSPCTPGPPITHLTVAVNPGARSLGAANKKRPLELDGAPLQ